MAEKIELNISANVSEAMKEVAGFRQQYAELVRQVEKPLRQVNSFRELESSLEQTGRKMREARDRVRELGNSLASVDRPTKEMAASYKLAVSELKALERQELTQISQLSRMRAALQGAGVDMRNLAAEQRRLAGEFSTRLDTGRADAALNSARSSLGVGAIEQTQRQLVDLRQQYRLVTSDSTLSAKQRAEAEANYRHSVEQTLTRLRELRQASSARAGSAGQSTSSSPSTQQTSQAAARSALGVGEIEQTQRKLVELRQQYRLVTSDGTLSAKQRAEAEANYRSSVASTLTQLRAMRGGLNDNSQSMQRAGQSAGQYRQAMQQLPMQLTDVVTSLASGMPIWLVAIQQGGQIRDSFGGIGNAARAIVSSISPMAAAIGGAAVAGGTLLAAFAQGQREASAYAQALIMSGNAAGTSADQLAAMAQRMDAANGTQRQAAAALAEIAGTGKFAADQIEAIGTTAVAMEEATGKAVSDTVAEFVSLADEPSKAAETLNKKYNFLTGAVYAQIAALEKQGDTEGAARLAVEAYGEAMTSRAAQVVENLGYLQTAWRAVGKVSSEAWDAMLDLGRADTLEEKLAKVERDLQQRARSIYTDSLFDSGPSQEELERQRTELTLSIQRRDADAKAQADRAQAEKESIDAQQKLNAALDDTRSAGEKLQERYRKIDEQVKAAAETGVVYTQEQIRQLREAAAKEFASEADSYQENLRKEIALHGKVGEVAKLRYALERGDLGELTAEQEKSLLADAEALDAKEAAAEATKKAETAAKQQAQTQAQQYKQQESYVAGLEKQAATLGLTAAQVRAYELAEKSLSGALNDRAKAALAVLAAQEKQQQADRNASTNAGLQADYLRATGQPAEAAMLEIESRFAQLRKQFVKDGNDAGLAMIDRLIPVEQAKAKLDGLQGEIDQAFERQSRGEQSIDTQVNAGLFTEMEGRQKLLDLHRQTADVIERYLPELEQMAQQPGPLGEQAAAEVGRVRNALVEARSAATEFKRTLEDGLSSGIQDAVQGLADGTLNLRDAVTSLVSSVADAMAQLAVQRLAEQATAGIMGLLGGQQSDSSLTTGATAVAGSAAAMSAAGGSLVTGAAAVQSAAASLAAANLTGATQSGGSGASGASGTSGVAGAISTASSQGAAEMGSSITAASETGSGTFSSALDSVFSGGADLFGSLFDSLGGLFGGGGGDSIFGGILGGIGGLFGGSSVAAATGGHVTGPGTTTSDSIPAMLSNWEYVTRAAVVQQPGALAFLDSFNRHGMAALDDYARRVRHATGGLAGVPAPALPAPSLGTTRLAEPAKALSTTVKNAINLNLVDSPERIASILNTPPGVEAVTVMLSNDPAKFRSILGI
ncbi:phage tail length tape measure family protein [Azotobacter beijerinckii]|uniref:Prophage tail length tape measure protein n=1 Tax=Azotobacter beijerinckii TaxID=170623 RepID=A0A1I1BIX7_9GAMM|nr:phage tail length tape measure family protein [Azotobacter beijerinckii]SFB48413.1 Prophage tail length tape measure protein [Azotobacter beijerinckii]